MARLTESQKKAIQLKKDRWIKQGKPFWTECLTCARSCEQNIKHGVTSYKMVNCDKSHKGNPYFPYKYEQLKREYQKEQEKRGQK